MVRNSLIVLLLLVLVSPAMAVAPGGVYQGDGAMTLKLDDKPLPNQQGFHLVRGVAIYHGRKIRFLSGIFLPPAYFHSKEPMPILMALHNRSGIGGDGAWSLTSEGMGEMLSNGKPDPRAQGDKPANPISIQTDAGFIGLVPHCPDGFTWESPAMADLMSKFIAQMVTAYHADDDRVYLTGFSYGASSSWRMAMNAPDRFAAIIVVDGRATPDPVHDVEKLRNVAVYLEVGQWDGDFVNEADWMHQALNNSGHRNYIFHMIPGGNHFNYESVYLDPDVWKWVYAQHRARKSPTNPILGSLETK